MVQHAAVPYRLKRLRDGLRRLTGDVQSVEKREETAEAMTTSRPASQRLAGQLRDAACSPSQAKTHILGISTHPTAVILQRSWLRLLQQTHLPQSATVLSTHSPTPDLLRILRIPKQTSPAGSPHRSQTLNTTGSSGLDREH
jgi:hypothetical protein